MSMYRTLLGKSGLVLIKSLFIPYSYLLGGVLVRRNSIQGSYRPNFLWFSIALLTVASHAFLIVSLRSGFTICSLTKKNWEFIPLVWIKFVIFTVRSECQFTTGVNKEYLWGRQMNYRVVKLIGGLFFMGCNFERIDIIALLSFIPFLA